MKQHLHLTIVGRNATEFTPTQFLRLEIVAVSQNFQHNCYADIKTGTGHNYTVASSLEEVKAMLAA